MFWFKKKKKERIRLSQEDLQWNKLMNLWCEEKLESPYLELVEYYNGISGEGHFCHFDNKSSNDYLQKYIATLSTILPEPLNKNVKIAYHAYIKNPDDISKENEAILENCDSVYYKNENLIVEILKDRASKINLEK